MNDQWTNRLSEYLDGELDSVERAALEAHLRACGHCFATLGELRQVVARAKSLEDTPPETELWPGIARQIRRERVPERRDRLVRRRFSLTVGQLLAASIALVLLSGGAMWMALQSRRQSNNGSVAETPSPAAPSGFRVARWKVQSDMAIAELQDALALNEAKLDTATVRVVRENLAIIDRAIAQAQRAL
ncbi:MAG TPA: anti-sigma factor, partial [Gemmatimonadales bacterium]|nr:anti-sigma factor [Gemmatimonadales bacterium]